MAHFYFLHFLDLLGLISFSLSDLVFGLGIIISIYGLEMKTQIAYPACQSHVAL